MRRLMGVLAVMLCAGGTAQGQADTSRPRPKPRPVIDPRLPDSIRTQEIGVLEVIEVIKGQAAATQYPDQTDPVTRHRMLATLGTQRQVWAERRPRTYAIRVLEVSHCISVRTGPRVDGALSLDQLVVRDTTVVRRDSAPIPARYEQSCPRAWRVDDLFAEVGRALADTTAYIADIQYDEAYGFPRAYRVRRGGKVIVESFAPVR